jgi:hypothetical protein
MAAMNAPAVKISNLKVLLVRPVTHLRAIHDRGGVSRIGHLLDGDGVAEDVLTELLLPFAIIPGDVVTAVRAEATVAPTQEHAEPAFVDLASLAEHLQYVGSKELFQEGDFRKPEEADRRDSSGDLRAVRNRVA